MNAVKIPLRNVKKIKKLLKYKDFFLVLYIYHYFIKKCGKSLFLSFYLDPIIVIFKGKLM